jgi:hypothetical protein
MEVARQYIRPKKRLKRPNRLNRLSILRSFLPKAKGGKTIAEYRLNDHIFVQGETANTIFYIKEGKVKLTVVSHQGKEAVVAILSDGDFLERGNRYAWQPPLPFRRAQSLQIPPGIWLL